jgi:hypothetical protein
LKKLAYFLYLQRNTLTPPFQSSKNQNIPIGSKLYLVFSPQINTREHPKHLKSSIAGQDELIDHGLGSFLYWG